MRKFQTAAAILLAPATLTFASCSAANSGDSDATSTPTPGDIPFEVTEMGAFEEPWALKFEPGTDRLFITEKAGTLKFLAADGTVGTVSGVPAISYGGQGGFGDIAFAPDYATSRNVYLSWVEDGEAPLRGAVIGLAKLGCSSATACALEDLKVIWRQAPKVEGGGHFSHRIAFSPDGQYLFVGSGERAKGDPAQDLSNNLGKVLRLNLDGTPAAGNPFADQGSPSNEIWSYGHRNIAGLLFDHEGKLWDLEHGPNGGDEINLVKVNTNYGWPAVSGGDNYDNTPIPRHPTRPEFEAPAIMWNPVIAPGNFIQYTGSLFPEWKNELIAVGLRTQVFVRMKIEGETVREIARYTLPGGRMRDIVQAPDGSIWIARDGPEAQIVKLTPAG